MRVIVFGQKWLAAEVLRVLLTMPRVTVSAVCPDPIDERLSHTAKKAGVPVVDFEAMPPCDIGVAAYCQRYIPPAIRARCGFGVLAYHPSLLPRHRGRDAVHWTLAMRDPIAGGTVYWMDEGADTGPVEAQDWCHVLPGDTPGEIWRRDLAPMGVKLLTDCVGKLAAGGSPHAIPQDERVATWEPALAKHKLAMM